MDIEWLMEHLGRSGVTTLLKVDDLRMAENGMPWTVVLSGPAVGADDYIRTDARSLEAGLTNVCRELQTRPGDWEWLQDWLQESRERS